MNKTNRNKNEKYIKIKIKGQDLQPDCAIKLLLWYKHSAILKSYIVITWDNSNWVTLNWSGSANQATFVVWIII